MINELTEKLRKVTQQQEKDKGLSASYFLGVDSNAALR